MPPAPRAPAPAAVPTTADLADVPAGSREVLPPVPPRAALRESVVGITLVVAGTLIALVCDFALGGGPAFLATARLWLVGVGATVAGHALSRRGDLWYLWAVAALTGYLAGGIAVPPHWDSLRLMLWVLAAVATAGACLAAMPARVRYPAIGLLAVVHFGGILSATTSPDPTPWLSATVGTRFYMPYLQFCYLRNAYHFYSPEPGPASLLFALVTYELDEPDASGKKVVFEWQVMPKRAEQTTDPLGISYYRRLSLTEYSARATADSGSNNNGMAEVRKRRDDVAAGIMPNQKRIPHAPPDYELPGRTYQPPQADAARYTLPSYARHIAFANTAPGRRVTNVKLYRAEHRIPTAQHFVTMKADPYHPILFRVFFLGDYTPEGKLVDPDDPMLYWLVPVFQKSPDLPFRDWTADQLEDYLSVHAGHVFEWRSLRP